MGAILAFLAEHADLLGVIYNAITTGKLTKPTIKDMIEQAMVAAADAEMKAEFKK